VVVLSPTGDMDEAVAVVLAMQTVSLLEFFLTQTYELPRAFR
jgi:hypothetical protein